jgi:hypothetical protein
MPVPSFCVAMVARLVIMQNDSSFVFLDGSASSYDRSLSTLLSSSNNTHRHEIAELSSNVALNIITLLPNVSPLLTTLLYSSKTDYTCHYQKMTSFNC